MDDNKTIQTFEKLLGQRIVDINYIETKFHYGASGDWTTINTDTIVLHSPEWEINFASGQKWFLTNTHTDATEKEPAKSIITVNSFSIAKIEDKIHKAPRTFGWENIFDKEITAIRFYKRVTRAKKIFGYELSKAYQDNIQIIQFFCSGKSFSITTMDGDIGQMDFYPTGYLGDKLGFFFDKTIVDSYTLYAKTTRELIMRMEMIYQTKKNNNR